MYFSKKPTLFRGGGGEEDENSLQNAKSAKSPRTFGEYCS